MEIQQVTKKSVALIGIAALSTVAIISFIAAVIYVYSTKTYVYDNALEAAGNLPHFEEMNFFNKTETIVKFDTAHSIEIWILGSADINKIENVIDKHKIEPLNSRLGKGGTFDLPVRYPKYFNKDSHKRDFDYSIEWTSFHVSFEDALNYMVTYNDTGKCIMYIRNSKRKTGGISLITAPPPGSAVKKMPQKEDSIRQEPL